MLSCFGIGRSREDREREPLLPRYDDDTALQARLHEKMHSYLMLRALSQGYMPSNEQAVINLRALLSSELLNPSTPNISDSGRALLVNVRMFLRQLIELLLHKNDHDQIQDFIWYLSKARLSVDTHDIGERASRAKAGADTAAAYKSLQTVGSLLLTNSDFRLFVHDLTTIGRQVFRDTAFTLADVSKEAGKQVEPSSEEQESLKSPDATGDTRPPPTKDDLEREAAEVTSTVAGGAVSVAQEAGHSATEHVTGDEQETLIRRLQRAVLKLRERRDYADSVSTLSLLVRRYLLVYSHALADTAEAAAEEDVDRNPETDRALHNFWAFLTSFGSRHEWDEVGRTFKAVIEHGKSDPEFDQLVRQIGNLVQDMLTDGDFFEHAEERFDELRSKSRQLASESSARDDLDALLDRLHKAGRSTLEDADVAKLLETTKHVAGILSPKHRAVNDELVSDSIDVFVPLAIRAIQYIPIPRLEVSTPAIDLLLENLVLEPGRTVNQSSFLPYKLNVSTRNDVEIRKARSGAASSVSTIARLSISGLSVAADDVGYWLRLHSGVLRLADAGIGGFRLDERGVDVAVDVEIGRERLENVVTLRHVRVRIHHLDYDLRKSNGNGKGKGVLAWLAWALKPLIRPVVRKALEARIARAVAEACHFANREVVFARERLRAARVADPGDLWTFVRAVAARLAPAGDPDFYARVGVSRPRDREGGVFGGVYAPGSLVKIWDEEGAAAGERVREYERGGWRNDVFDVGTTGV